MAKKAWWDPGALVGLDAVDAALARDLAAKHRSAEQAAARWPAEHRWLLTVLGAEQSEREWSFPTPPGPSAGAAKVRKWAEEAGVADLLEWMAGQVARDAGMSVHLSHYTVRESLRRARWVSGPVLEALERHSRARAAFAALESEQRPTWARAMEHPELEAARALLYRDYRDSRTLRVPRPSFDSRVELDLERLTLSHGPAWLRIRPLELRGSNLESTLHMLQAVTRPPDALLAELARPAWERGLASLDSLLEVPEPPPDDKPLLGWEIVSSTSLHIVPVRCRQKKTGTGYVLKRIDRVHAGLCTEPADHVLRERSTEELHLDPLARIDALVGHPRVFCDRLGRRGDPIHVRHGRVALGLVDRDGSVAVVVKLGGRELSAQEDLVGHADLLLRFGSGALTIGRAGQAMRWTIQRLLEEPFTVPQEGRAALLERLPRWAARVGLEADPGVLGPSVEADPRPVLRMEMTEEGLAVEARVQPLPEVPSAEPGQGSALLASERDGATVHLVRDLEREPDQVERALAPLGLPSAGRDGFRWLVPDLQDALRVIEAARERSGHLQLRWAGAVPGLAGRLDARDLDLKVERSRDWFGIGGSARAGRQRVPLKALLEAVAEGHTYVALGKDQWVGLSDALQQHVANLIAAGGTSDGAVELSPLHAHLLDPLVEEGATLDAPPDWTDTTDRLHEAAARDWPVPDGLLATLRPYQERGIAWLQRMAHWAPGACLADDMGLGKTLQTLGLLLARASGGPALVVVPASVIENWRREVARFAPSLTVRTHWGPTRTLEALRPGELVLTTYGTLLRDAEPLAAIPFQTIVLDEAQAIKNPSSQRARAAFELQGAFRLALSGTPVENRTEELWSLLRFLAPGLLGSRARFQTTFVSAIESQRDTRVRAGLARLVGPFVLRRTKGEVARDLPSRTELVRSVTLSPAERALYERTRLECVARIEGGLTQGALGVATELLKLRKLACHPRLYDDGSPLQSSKLKAVVRTLEDLRTSGHRALVFSQFTRHLGLVREALDEAGFTVRYLDGKMALDARQREVDAFQAGHGEVFLISLKAGGTGLNLTAATWVLHLDPWWNPAAEDQATDRAHRIGQTEPVTVIRFVAEGTVEEQIVALHEEKRELAEALLSGRAGSAGLPPEQVLALLRQPMELAATAPEPEAPRPEPAPTALPPEAPPDPRPVTPRHAPAPLETLDPESILERFHPWLLEAGRKPHTTRAYVNAARNLMAWLGEPVTLDTLTDRGPAYVVLAKRGEGGALSDKVYASPALGALVAMLTPTAPG
ncbi:MAG: DEAD/DEAH box helicase [Myxococcales bacterium]|nr:DEAD/DEAH box helicase [Myxococcales bacterium]